MGKKKILFIYPSSYNSENCLIKSSKSFVPFRTLPYLAALTPKHYETHIIDELVENVNFNEDVDLVALTGMTRHMPRAIDIAGEFRKRGKTTIIGGIGAFSIRERIEEYDVFNSLVIGEAEELWETILDDFQQGRLKTRYECIHPPALKGLPLARFDLLNLKKYIRSFWDRKYPVIPIETSRGCPHNCKFCFVTRYFGRKMRYRPVGEVIEEIKYQRAKFILFTDDNIAVNPERTRELFLAVKPLGIQWFGQFESKIAEQPELLQLAAESGCRAALVGIESLIRDNFGSINKSQYTKLDFKDIVRAFKKAGVPLLASIIFGMDHDTPETIEWTIEQMIKNRVDIIFPHMLTPLPGTPFYNDCKKEGRLIHENYSLYDYWHPVMRPKQMTQENLEQCFWQGLRRFYSLRFILSRVLHEKKWKIKIPGLFYNLYFRQQARKGLHPII